MQKTLIYSYIGLLVLTLLVAILSLGESTKMLILIIAFLSIVKFWLVGFEFVELKKAHTFWKLLFLFFGLLVATVFIVLF
jgi:hypothetical protein